MPEPVRAVEEVLAACLDELAAGATPAECLGRYPEHEAELRALLPLAAQLQVAHWPALSTGARARGREKMHRALHERHHRWSWLPLWEQAGVLAFLAVCVVAAWLAWPGSDRKVPAPAGQVPPAAATSAPAMVIPTAMPGPSDVAAAPAGAVISVTATVSPTATLTPRPLSEPGATPQVIAAPPAGSDRPAPALPASPAPTPAAVLRGSSADEPAASHEDSVAAPPARLPEAADDDAPARVVVDSGAGQGEPPGTGARCRPAQRPGNAGNFSLTRTSGQKTERSGQSGAQTLAGAPRGRRPRRGRRA